MGIVLFPSVPLPVDAGSGSTFTNLGPATVYYGSHQSVSSSSSDGSIVAGGTSPTLTGTVYLVLAPSATRANVNINNSVTGSEVAVQDEGTDVALRSKINFVGTAVAAVDDPTNDRVNVTVTGGSASSTVTNVKDAPYNAAGNGTTDDTAAIQAAINTGGTVFFPAGTYKVTSTLVCDSKQGLRLTGPGGTGQFTSNPASILFTATTGPVISCHSVFGFELDRLRVTYNNTSFSGHLIDIDGNPLAADCDRWSIHDMSTNYTGAGVGPATSGIRLNKAIDGAIRDCHFKGAVNHIRIGDPGGAYVVSVVIEKCEFNTAGNAHILVGSSDAEAITIRDCTFEAGTNTPGIRGANFATDGNDHQLYNPTIEGNWFGDAGTGVIWVNDLATTSNAYFGTIRGNFFASSQGGTHLKLRGAWIVEGNSFQSGTVFDSTDAAHVSLVCIGNYFGTTSAFNATNFTAGTPTAGWVSLQNKGSASPADALPTITKTVAETGNFNPNPVTTAQQNQIWAFTRSGAVTTLHPSTDGASFTFPVGAELWLYAEAGASIQVVTSGAGVTLNAPNGAFIHAGCMAKLTQVALNVWNLSGQTFTS